MCHLHSVHLQDIDSSPTVITLPYTPDFPTQNYDRHNIPVSPSTSPDDGSSEHANYDYEMGTLDPPLDAMEGYFGMY